MLDVNDRSLRDVVLGLGARRNGVVRETGFDMTAASEVMVLLTLATSLRDLRERLGRIVIGYTGEGQSVSAEDLGAAGAMAVLLEDAISPNLLQTLVGGPAIIHCGPYGNIAPGTSSVTADLIAMRGSDDAITEAGFGADLGAERFFNVKCRVSGLRPDVAVIVATVRGLKSHSGRYSIRSGRPLPDGLLEETPATSRPVCPTCASTSRSCGASACTGEGGAGALELAQIVMEAAHEPTIFEYLYPLDLPLEQKIEAMATQIYGADGVSGAGAA